MKEDLIIRIGKNKIWNLTTFKNNILVPLYYLLTGTAYVIIFYVFMIFMFAMD